MDCGVLFPEEHQHGVDVILPDFSRIRDRLDKIVAIVLAATQAFQKALGELIGSAAHDPEQQEQAIARAMSVWIRRTYERSPVIIPIVSRPEVMTP